MHMNWSHALLMAELLLKAADNINTTRPIAATKENATMGDQTPIDTSTAAPATIENDPTTTPTTTVEGAVPAQSSAPTSASASTQTLISNAVEQPAISTPETVADVVQGAVTDKPDDLRQSISDLVKLAQILDSNPALFAFLKTLTPNTPPSKT